MFNKNKIDCVKVECDASGKVLEVKFPKNNARK